MKRFYRQRKSAANKSSSSKSRKKSKVVAPRPEDDYSLDEKVLRQFDMDMTYGPCIGLTRIQRWERAHTMGLNPPPQIKCLLENDKLI
ncbi:DNA polymerase delta subunit 4, partial [Mucuna pruriens]